MRRSVGDTQAAERRTWNSKSSDETSVTNGERVPFAAMVSSSSLSRRFQEGPFRNGLLKHCSWGENKGRAKLERVKVESGQNYGTSAITAQPYITVKYYTVELAVNCELLKLQDSRSRWRN